MKSILEEMTLADVRDADFRVAVLPFGATEPHNLHLPYGTDTLEGRCIGQAICDAANAQGGRVVLLPTIPYGTETNMNQLPLAMNLNPSTVLMVVKDLVESIQRAGIRKIVFLNSHGGNELKPVLRELHGQTNSQLFLCNWFQMVRDRYHEIFEVAEDHAGEMETSLALAYFPEFVVHNDDDTLRADAGSRRPMRFEALNEGWVSITRPWHLLTTNSGSGNPHAASADKGRAVMDLIVQRIAPFLAELSQAELDDEFPFA
ncbi:creatininase family protein [Rosistilla oblonga]|uniref:Creatinine amidohydrolase n=1 Tax=Rosistilla oblonga TaxID=2527990 RepID=A0A518IZ36_9BACT|nr:creatininase family protein [Rosistilla oblonga]QDV58348.1 Creatinine amidohydrolase [Rosistilla oblonga]